MGEGDAIDLVYTSSALGMEETSIVYSGEYAMGISVVFRTDRIRWSLEADSGLFMHQASGGAGSSVSAGTGRTVQAQLDPSVPTGIYGIDVHLNSTEEGGWVISERYVLTVRCEKAVEIVDIDPPTGYGSAVVIMVRTLIEAEELVFKFDADGDIEVTTEESIVSNPSIGVHRFESIVVEDRSSPDQRGLSYFIILRSRDRIIEVSGEVPVSGIWYSDDDPLRVADGDRCPAALTICIVALLFIFNYLYYLRKGLRVPST